MNELKKRIDGAIAATKPRTKARRNALLSVEWVLRAKDGGGYVNAFELGRPRFSPDIRMATAYSGCDNEDLKLRFFQALLLTELEVVPL